MLSEGRTGEAGEARDGTQKLSVGDLPGLASMVRIGITGHRDLADREQAEAAVADALDHLLTALEKAKWPTGIVRSVSHSGIKVGYRIVSPLAEGADRVVAELVLSPDPRLADRTRELVVPLPFRVDEYRGPDGQPGTDCQDLRSQAEFDRLASLARWVRPVHPHAPGSPAQRKAWYRDAGAYVIEHCDFLFALWDGRDNGKEAGTADIVKLALGRGTPVIWIPVARKAAAQEAAEAAAPVPGGDETKLLIGLAAENDGPALTVGLSSPQASVILAGRDSAPSAVRLLLERFGRTAALLRYAQRDRGMQKAVVGQMASAAAAAPVGATAVQSVSEWIIPAYVMADGLAKRYQRALKVLNIGVYAAASAAVTLGAFAAILFPYLGYWRIPVICEAAVLVALFLVQALDIRRKCRDQWVTFRAMGEYFRAGRFLALVTPATAAGLEFDRFALLYSRPSWKPASVPWFNPVVERMWEHRPVLHPQDCDTPWLATYLINEWIDDQINYHQSSAKTHLNWDNFFRWTIKAILLATVLIVISHVVLDYRHEGRGRDLVSISLAFFTIALTSLAAAFNGYSGQQRHSYHSLRFGRMAAELKRIRKMMRGATTMEELRTHLREARRIMLGETFDWYEEMERQVIDSPT